MDSVFRPADILIPACDLTKWSCVACDQFTSEPEYWHAAERLAGDAPSALRLIVPEAYLGQIDEEKTAAEINARMEEYLASGLFREYPDSFVYVERTLSTGQARRGLVGALDLEAYDWAPGSKTPVRATEGTVESRLPPRVRVRMGAPLELPHIMVFIDDPPDAVMDEAAGGEPLYDFELMQGCGHIKGFAVRGAHAHRVQALVNSLAGSPRFAMGDGNHSLATAKRCWESIRAGLDETARETHPARFALVELVNIMSDAVEIEPIHRVLLGTDAADYLTAAGRAFPDAEAGLPLTFLTDAGRLEVRVPGLTIGELIASVDDFLLRYMSEHGGGVDYIHGDGAAAELCRRGGAGVLLPAMDKAAIFPSVEKSGPFPRKSFSIGHAPDKRCYLECRRIK